MAAFNFQLNSGPDSPPHYFYESSTQCYQSSQVSLVEQTAQQLATQQGLPTANFFLARCFDTGEGVPQDHAKAVEFYYAAAEAGMAEAQHNLACCFLNGEGVHRDLKMALHYFVTAANQGYTPALYNLGNLMEANDPYRAAKYYQKAARNGHAQACFSLACMCDSGKGVLQSYEEAAILYFRAAEMGLPEAQFNLACSYDMGQGVTQNYSEAVKYYTLAAEQGHAMAQFNLAQCYHQGKGVGISEAGAVYYYRLAAQQGIAVPNLSALQCTQRQPTAWPITPTTNNNNHYQNQQSLFAQRPRAASFQTPPQIQIPMQQSRTRAQTYGQNLFSNGPLELGNINNRLATPEKTLFKQQPPQYHC